MVPVDFLASQKGRRLQTLSAAGYLGNQEYQDFLANEKKNTREAEEGK